jgi:hypothetical protein
VAPTVPRFRSALTPARAAAAVAVLAVASGVYQALRAPPAIALALAMSASASTAVSGREAGAAS